MNQNQRTRAQVSVSPVESSSESSRQQIVSKLGPKALCSSLHSSPSTIPPQHHPWTPKPSYPHSLSQQTYTNCWRKPNFCTTTLGLPVGQPITTLAAVLDANFGSFQILFANSPWKVSRREISCSAGLHSRTARPASHSSPQQLERTINFFWLS